MVEQLGIVYTPTECVDFIIHSVNDVLQKEFGRSISDEGIHVLDPFTGTGTFMTRLIQSGLIKPEDLKRKYQHELHANEIVLLAYYIATINIENAFHDMTPEDDGIGTDTYIPFEGIVLTDTFQLGETEDGNKIFSEMFPQNSERVKKQVQAPLRVILGNPPYSVGQKSANDLSQNQIYPKLENRISETYVKCANSNSLKQALYDSYIKAFRWSTDRLDESGGIIAFISNGSWLDGNSTDGFRKAIEKEFTSIYVFNLRGNQRTSGELSRKEGGKIFGSGSRTPISITLLVKNPNVNSESATIHYHDIGDYLTREQKLDFIKNYSSVGNAEMPWTVIKPNEHGDWISVRNSGFNNFISLGSKSKEEKNLFFRIYSGGVITHRDNWLYSFSNDQLSNQLKEFINKYNNETKSFIQQLDYGDFKQSIEEFVDKDESKIKWNKKLFEHAEKGIIHTFVQKDVIISQYRPFTKQWYYYNKDLNWSRYSLPKIYPNREHNNFTICIEGAGSSKGFSVLISECVTDFQTLMNSICFPLYYYEENASNQEGMFGEDSGPQYTRKDAISDFIHEKALQQYGLSKTGSGTITKEDIFYYVYGFLHSPEYRETFANDLKKMLPRIPLVDSINDFWAYSKAGRALADLHINYESIAPYPDCIVTGAENSFFTVEKMRFPKKGQKDTINYNSKITISDIPEKAYEYVVNGKSAIEWIMERYQITTHKDSGITNNPNDWSEEVGNPRYILDLLLSIINVSVQTVDIVKGLPKVKFGE
jgi:predicted helicase